MTAADPHLTRFEGPSPVAQIARDLVRRGLWAAPVMLGLGFLIWGTEGLAGVALGMALVLANFAIAAAIIATTSRISLALLMGGVLFGFLIRLGVIFLAVYLVRRRRVDRSAGARPHADHHAPGPAVLGAAVRLVVDGLPGAQARCRRPDDRVQRTQARPSPTTTQPGTRPTPADTDDELAEPADDTRATDLSDTNPTIDTNKEHSQP